MGQYWKAVNLDKKEFIHPHGLGSGLKLWEIIAQGEAGVGVALCVLLADMPERRGHGDLYINPYVGRWVGDRVALIGEYSKEGDKTYGFYPDDNNDFVDITRYVASVIASNLDGDYHKHNDRFYFERC